jgi:hypothetical protein
VGELLKATNCMAELALSYVTESAQPPERYDIMPIYRYDELCVNLFQAIGRPKMTAMPRKGI